MPKDQRNNIDTHSEYLKLIASQLTNFFRSRNMPNGNTYKN